MGKGGRGGLSAELGAGDRRVVEGEEHTESDKRVKLTG